jgi:EAL domain-containing protein (putative c-di-GMP-specific phosphodiesterase class I)
VIIPYKRHEAQVKHLLDGRTAAPGAAGAALLASLGACLDPLIHLDAATSTGDRVAGFEGVALGSGGESFSALLAAAAQLGVAGDALRAVMLLVVGLTARDVLVAAAQAGVEAREELLFTANLDEALLRSELLDHTLQQLADAGAPPLLLEVSETMPADAAAAVLALATRHDVALALDDVDQMDPAALARLGPHARLVKLSPACARDCLAERDPSALAAVVTGVRLPGCPTVLEGISREGEHDFLRRAWNPAWGPLWVQSHAPRGAASWAAVLRPLTRHRTRGGFYLAATS